jgi:hypothetical protein
VLGVGVAGVGLGVDAAPDVATAELTVRVDACDAFGCQEAATLRTVSLSASDETGGESSALATAARSGCRVAIGAPVRLLQHASRASASQAGQSKSMAVRAFVVTSLPMVEAVAIPRRSSSHSSLRWSTSWIVMVMRRSPGPRC